MARSSYRNFMRLLDKWPVDPTKAGGRDLGEHLRVLVTRGFKLGDATHVDQVECHRIYSSLNRIASNTHSKQYPRSLTSTATGLSVEECRQISSKEFLEEMKEHEKGFLARLFKRT
ncbi:ubiquinol-cytochrome-c reductase complex assembly factor 2-like [Homarus americanus]|uniref:ubiquinol-cytochrome-c reductase complex assembly factor 2-like n=1 Tax=Homarus americanus TaxID=6706 RepID=UPI001C44B420|nr:ubiquinol-cytochrome-c reductase complex assembly factor 2-like [Homarus americanus]